MHIAQCGGNNNRSNQRGNQDPRLVAPNPSDSRCSKVSDSPRRWDRSFEDGITRSWCAKCVLRRTSTGQDNTNPGRWTDGRAKHYTDEHRGNNTTRGNSNRANLAQSNGNGPPPPPPLTPLTPPTTTPPRSYPPTPHLSASRTSPY